MKILIVAPAWIGDAVMASALYERLKSQVVYNPQTKSYESWHQIDVIAPSWSAALHARMPVVNEVITADFKHGEFGFFKRILLGKQLRKKHYDQAYLLPNSWKSALVPFFAHIPKRIGFIGESRYGLLTHPVKLDKKKWVTMIERFCALAGHQTSKFAENTLETFPKLVTSDYSQKKLLKQFSIDQNRPMLAICPGAAYGPSKQWPAIHFAELAAYYLKRDFQVVILGGQAEEGIAADIESLISEQTQQKCLSMVGKTSLVEVIDAIGLATHVVSNDSGLMHIAAALDKPLVAIYGATPKEFAPPSNKRSAVFAPKDLACAPCVKRTCEFGHYHCLTQTMPKSVIEALSKLDQTASC